jgi:hypothetical protein
VPCRGRIAATPTESESEADDGKKARLCRNYSLEDAVSNAGRAMKRRKLVRHLEAKVFTID